MSDDAPYPEPDGYSSEAGFVKSNPLNNEHYLNQFQDHPWWHAIKSCADALEREYPGYNISQIKEKFGRLCIYVGPGTSQGWSWGRVHAITNYWEAWADGYEHAQREVWVDDK